jgi:hypothetical protein
MAKDLILPADDLVQRRNDLKVVELGGPKEKGDCLVVWDGWKVARGKWHGGREKKICVGFW